MPWQAVTWQTVQVGEMLVPADCTAQYLRSSDITCTQHFIDGVLAQEQALGARGWLAPPATPARLAATTASYRGVLAANGWYNSGGGVSGLVLPTWLNLTHLPADVVRPPLAALVGPDPDSAAVATASSPSGVGRQLWWHTASWGARAGVIGA
jgi:hypothetical protein